jgi:hypothetical protein
VTFHLDMPETPSDITSDVQGDDSEKLSSLHSEFRTTIMLLTLVTAINNEGRSTLKTPARANDPTSLSPGILDSPEPTAAVLLNALSAIFVRDNEVIAVVTNHTVPSQDAPLFRVLAMQDPKDSDVPHKVSTEQATQDVRHPGDLSGDVSDEDMREWHEVNFNAIRRSVERIAALANPDSKDEYFKEGDDEYLLIPEGRSHWPSVLKDSWYGLVVM